jgi:hypothetical protein
MLAVRRKGLGLFQFKYYRDQDPLKLSPQEIALIENGLEAGDHETRLIASKIIIKVCSFFFFFEL